MPSVSGGALRPSRPSAIWPTQYRFLCPRCRAGLCDGCLAGLPLTCSFGVRSAILPGNGAFGKASSHAPAQPAADLGVYVRQPTPRRAVPAALYRLT